MVCDLVKVGLAVTVEVMVSALGKVGLKVTKLWLASWSRSGFTVSVKVMVGILIKVGLYGLSKIWLASWSR